MGKYLGQQPCPSCGSRDNLGVWSDGAFCFGCGYRKKERNIDEFFQSKSDDDPRDSGLHGVPSDHPNPECLEWLNKYGLDWADVRVHDGGFSKFRNQLVFGFKDPSGRLVCTVARNFDPDRAEKAKYYTSGAKEETCQVYQKGPELLKTLVITEDALSAIKVSKVCDATPALGTNMSVRRLTNYYNLGYRDFVIWLDRDKWKEAMNMADTLKWMGASARCFYSEHDPKTYSIEQIQEFLK